MRLSIIRQINEVEVEIENLKNENASLKKSIEDWETNINQMPKKEQELIGIKRDYQNIKANYEQLLESKQQIELQTKLNLSQRGAKFKLIDEARLPTTPSKRPGPIVALGGIFSSILTLFGIPFLLQTTRNTYTIGEDLEKDTNIPLLEVIPPIETETHRVHRNKVLYTSFAASVVGVIMASLILTWVIA